MRQNEALKTKIEKLILSSKEINFNDIANFNWDIMYIITPYDHPKEILTNENTKWEKIDRSIEIEDNISLIISLYKGRIVSYLNYPRKNGDFKISKSKKFNKTSARFKIDNSNDDLELIPIP